MRGFERRLGRVIRAGSGYRALAIGIILVAVSLKFWTLLDWSDLSYRDTANPNFLEAQSILRGEITLSERVHDTALYKGRVLNVFQPGQTLLFLAHLVSGGDEALEFFQIEIFAVFVLSVFLLTLALFELSDGQVVLSVSLAASAMFGAPYIASLPIALKGNVYRSNHCLSILLMTAFLLVVAGNTPRYRLLLIGACVGAAMLFRLQNVLLLFLPLSILLQDSEGRSWQISKRLSTPTARKALAGEIAKLLVFPTVALIIIAGFQIARFHNPLETGYAYLYDGREDYLAERASSYGLFSLHFLPENIFRTIFAFPTLEFDGLRISRMVGEPQGNSLVFSQPILLIILLLGRGAARARAQSFVITALLLAIPVWLYHNPGVYAPGYMRLSLDYLPVWIAAIAVSARYAQRSMGISTASVFLATCSLLYGRALLEVGISL